MNGTFNRKWAIFIRVNFLEILHISIALNLNLNNVHNQESPTKNLNIHCGSAETMEEGEIWASWDFVKGWFGNGTLVFAYKRWVQDFSDGWGRVQSDFKGFDYIFQYVFSCFHQNLPVLCIERIMFRSNNMNHFWIHQTCTLMIILSTDVPWIIL